MSQTDAERREAIRSLLPCLTAHLLANPSAQVIPPAPWVSEGAPPPPHMPPPPCDSRCFGCTLTCRAEPWERVYRGLRAAYPILYQLEAFLRALGDIPWGYQRLTAIRYTYLEPCDVFAHSPWPGLAEQGVGWLAARFEEAGEDVPVYAPPSDARANERRQRAAMWELVRRLAAEGLSHRAIAERTGYSKSQVARILDPKGVLTCLIPHAE